MNLSEIEPLIRFAQLGKKVLAERVLTLIGLLFCAAAFGAALWLPTWERATAASLFAVLVYWPLVRIEKAKSTEKEAP